MGKTVLVTGGFGFLGRGVARRFKQDGYRVVGIGRGRWPPEEAQARGFDLWLDAGVKLSNLLTLPDRFDVIAHCAGNGSVAYSLTNPLEDFYKTVQSTADLLEFLRLTSAGSLVIYPSSAAVYGTREDAPIRESDPLNPISPYGYHKRMVEELLASYSATFGVRAVVIRFFSIYGPGLTKQLLWDASAKLLSPDGGPAVFWGTGEETRDWINADDATALMQTAADSTAPLSIINGAVGARVTVREVLSMLRNALGVKKEIVFNNVVRAGDPRYFRADTSRARALNWQPAISLQVGIAAYCKWLARYQRHGRETD